MKAKKLLGVLTRKPLSYRVHHQKGSHRTLRSEEGYPEILFSFHDGTTIAPGAVRKILTRDVGLEEHEALQLL